MFKKIKIIFFSLFKSRFCILKNTKKKFIIFDKEGSLDLIKILPENSYFILETRSENLSKIYFSKKIIFKTLKNFLFKKKKLFNSYLISIIEEIEPEVVITFIDNSFKFFEISKVLEDKIKFIAIQHSSRYDLLRHKLEYQKGIRSEDLSKRFYIPHFYCFGQHEKEHYTKNNIYVKKFNIIGSLKLMNAMQYFEEKKEKFHKNKYDICLVSDDGYDFNKTFKEKTLETDYALIAKNTIKYSMKFNKKLIFSWKRYKNHGDHKKEYSFYKNNLNESEFNYLLENSIFKDDNYNSYRCILQSNIVIGVTTTMLRETLSLKGKILTCNYTSLPYFNFPVNGVFVQQNHGYDNFEKKLTLLLNMSHEEYLKKIESIGEYTIKYYDKEDLKNLKRKIQS